ncbi:hypothetical protein [Pseudolysinimonas sp.]
MSVRAAVKAWMPVIVAGGVLAVGGLVAIPLGGWNTVQLQSTVIPEQPIGQPYVGERLATAIDDVYLTDEHPNGYEELEPGEEWLIVVATLENQTDTPQDPMGSTSFWSFTVPGVVELGEPLSIADYWVRLVRDDTNGAVLSPGVPDTVMFVFRVDDGLFSDGDEVRIGLTDAEAQPADIIEGTRWWQPHIAVEVPVVLREER